MTFDEWLDEIEVFSARRERLYEDIKDDIEIVDKWLKAAYNVGRTAGLQEAYDKMREYGDCCFNMQVYPKIEKMIEESK